MDWFKWNSVCRYLGKMLASPRLVIKQILRWRSREEPTSTIQRIRWITKLVPVISEIGIQKITSTTYHALLIAYLMENSSFPRMFGALKPEITNISFESTRGLGMSWFQQFLKKQCNDKVFFCEFGSVRVCFKSSMRTQKQKTGPCY